MNSLIDLAMISLAGDEESPSRRNMIEFCPSARRDLDIVVPGASRRLV